MPSKFKLDREAERGQAPRVLIEVVPPQLDTLPKHSSERLSQDDKSEETLHVSEHAVDSNTGRTKTALPSISERDQEHAGRELTEHSEEILATSPHTHPSERDACIADKVQRYESFVEDTLRAKLRQIAEERSVIAEEIATWEKLRGSIDLIKASAAASRASSGPIPMRSLVNVGCDMYMQAVVPDSSRICVNVGLGFFPELTLDEASALADRRCEALQKRLDAKAAAAAEVAAQIEVVLKGIQELLGVSDRAPAPRTFL